MKCHPLGFAALLTLALRVHTAFVHVDVSANQDVAIDVNNKPKSASRPERGQSSQPVYRPRKVAHILKDYEVDLDYEIHGGVLSDSGNFVKFKNIPYAAPPVGQDRFFEPNPPPQSDRRDVNYGSNDNVCPQIQVGWASKALEFSREFTVNPDLADWQDEITPADYGPMEYPPKNVSEDCLTLDVMVPKKVWDRRKESYLRAPVIVWVHGGGFVYGWKDQYGSPEGLFDSASKDEQGNIIYVAMNYRLGAFGWLGGANFWNEGGFPNLGLLDQAFAMEWVKGYITEFGGDGYKVTMMGQSAGASSIMHHITSRNGYDGKSPKFPMQAAIIQSPGFFPRPNATQDDEMYTKFLQLAGVDDLDALRTVNTKVLQDANAKMVYESMYGYFNFGPTIDGQYVQDLPGKILAQGDIPLPALLVGHTKLDGLLFTPPWIRTATALLDHVRKLFPGVPQAVLDRIQSVYPVKVGLGPKQAILEVTDFFNDIAIRCNSMYLTEASLKSRQEKYHPVYRYIFNALPAVHGYDLGYTYYPNPAPTPVNETLATYYQDSIVNFARYLDPNPENSEYWGKYTANNRKIMNMGSPDQTDKPDYTTSPGNDPMDRSLCEFWQSAPYYAPGSKGSSDQQFVVQDEAHATYREDL